MITMATGLTRRWPALSGRRGHYDGQDYRLGPCDTENILECAPLNSPIEGQRHAGEVMDVAIGQRFRRTIVDRGATLLKAEVPRSRVYEPWVCHMRGSIHLRAHQLHNRVTGATPVNVVALVKRSVSENGFLFGPDDVVASCENFSTTVSATNNPLAIGARVINGVVKQPCPVDGSKVITGAASDDKVRVVHVGNHQVIGKCIIGAPQHSGATELRKIAVIERSVMVDVIVLRLVQLHGVALWRRVERTQGAVVHEPVIGYFVIVPLQQDTPGANIIRRTHCGWSQLLHRAIGDELTIQNAIMVSIAVRVHSGRVGGGPAIAQDVVRAAIRCIVGITEVKANKKAERIVLATGMDGWVDDGGLDAVDDLVCACNFDIVVISIGQVSRSVMDPRPGAAAISADGDWVSGRAAPRCVQRARPGTPAQKEQAIARTQRSLVGLGQAPPGLSRSGAIVTVVTVLTIYIVGCPCRGIAHPTGQDAAHSHEENSQNDYGSQPSLNVLLSHSCLFPIRLFVGVDCTTDGAAGLSWAPLLAITVTLAKGLLHLKSKQHRPLPTNGSCLGATHFIHSLPWPAGVAVWSK